MYKFRLTIGSTTNPAVDRPFHTLGAAIHHLTRNEMTQLNICGTAFIYELVEDGSQKCIAVFDLAGMGNPPSQGVASATS